MMMNNDDRERIRSRADIGVVIGRYVGLKARGPVMKGLCPFHKEKTPSFTVNPSKGFFHCFGCGKGGDVFRFLQEIEGIDFREALEMLAEETGVTLNRGAYDSPPQATYAIAQTSKTELLSINDEAANFYYQNIKKYPQAVDFFKSRGLSAQTVKEFRLGYAPAEWQGLCDYLQSKGVSRPKIVECGLAVCKDDGQVYDRFRDRAMFPISDRNERVVAFAGRALASDAQPKYINSPETSLYQKSRLLYGLDKARAAIRESHSLSVVEGYMDYLTLYQAGIRNAVAVSGTAFTDSHARLISGFAEKVTLVFDGDSAGLAAALKTALTLAPFNLQVSVLALPNSDDPDSFVKREGAAAFLELLRQASPAADFLIDAVISKQDGSLYGKSKAADELLPYARALTDPISRESFLNAMARRLRIERPIITEKFKAGGAAHLLQDAPPALEEYDVSHNGIGIGKLEEDFFRILITRPELIVSARPCISPDFFTDTLSANIYSIILDVYAKKGSLDGLPDAVAGDGELARLISMLCVKPMFEENIQDELVQKIMLLRRKHFKELMAMLTEKLNRSSETEKAQILKEIQECGDRLKEWETLA